LRECVARSLRAVLHSLHSLNLHERVEVPPAVPQRGEMWRARRVVDDSAPPTRPHGTDAAPI